MIIIVLERGVIDGISYCNIKKDNELNVRIADEIYHQKHYNHNIV